MKDRKQLTSLRRFLLGDRSREKIVGSVLKAAEGGIMNLDGHRREKGG